MKANPKRKRKCVALQAPHRFEVPDAAQLEQWYGSEVVAAITRIRQQQTDTEEAAIQERLNILLQEVEKGNKLALEMLLYLSHNLTEIVRILDSKMEEEIKTRVVHALNCASEAFLDSLESD